MSDGERTEGDDRVVEVSYIVGIVRARRRAAVAV
jgi:hypothetical protein